MEKYQIGEWIAELRIRKGLTQEELSDGICSVATLSRIENGGAATVNVRKLLLERLGSPDMTQRVFVTNRDENIRKLKRGIMRYRSKKDIDELERMIGELENVLKDGDDTVDKQHLAYGKAFLRQVKNEDMESVLRDLDDVLAMRLKSYDPANRIESIKVRKVLDFMEIDIINQIAIQLYHMGELKESRELLELIGFYGENKIAISDRRERISMIVGFNLMFIAITEKRFQDAYIMCQNMIDRCVANNRLEHLPELCKYMAYLSKALGRPITAYRISRYVRGFQKIGVDVKYNHSLNITQEDIEMCYSIL